MTRILPISDPSAWSEAKHILKNGGVVAFPAEFSYALSEAPEWTAAGTYPWENNRRIFRMKGRDPGKPVLYLAGSLSIVERFAYLPEGRTGRGLVSLWPGFLTLVLKARPLAIRLGMASSGGVSFRIPRPILLRRFLNFLRTPLSGTSLNPSGRDPVTNVRDAIIAFPELDAYFDGGTKPGMPVSTVIDVRHGPAIVIRNGTGAWSRWASIH
jgi:L-threonylcarbamoyladenylate synthase